MPSGVGATRTGTGGQAIARRYLASVFLVLAAAIATAADGSAAHVTVAETRGTYSVSANFAVPQPAATVFAVLTDYEQIPEMMPGVRSSAVLERNGDRVVVEQEAIAKFMLFSKRVHLVLDVQEESRTIRFHDRCGKSFERYEGEWTIVPQIGGTAIRYDLTAKPSFDVPEFVLKRLLKRDSLEMIARLQSAIAKR